jgi:stromal membrane-associated protein
MNKAEQVQRFVALRARPANDRCAECLAADTTWVVLDYGVLICVHCAGAHRGLGTHISKVRSTQHDTFSQSEFEWIESLGNEKSAALYEAALPERMRRPATDSPEVIRRTWLRHKYDELRFTAGQDFRDAPSHESFSGWLLKQGSIVPTWKRRHFCIRAGALLCYFSDESESEASFKGALPLAGCRVLSDPDEPCSLRLQVRAGRASSSHCARARTTKRPQCRSI